MYDRSTTIGASDVPIILGLSTFQTPMGLWLSKVEPGERVETAAMEIGNRLEAGVRDWTAKRLGATRVLPGPTIDEEPFIASFAPWAVARPDAVMVVGGETFNYEGKVRRRSEGWGEQGEDIIPDDTRCQTVWQNAVTDLPGCHVGALLLSHGELRTYFTPRDAELEAVLVDRIGEWWVKHLDPHGPRHAPDLDGSPATQEYLRKRWPTQTAGMREATPEEVALVLEYTLAKATAKAAEERADLLKAQIQAAIAENEGLTTPHGKVSWKFQEGSVRIDGKALRAKYPEIAAEVEKQGEALRVLRSTVKAPE